MKIFADRTGAVVDVTLEKSKGATLQGLPSASIIVEVTARDNEMLKITKCFNEVHRLYAFGKDVRGITITLLIPNFDCDCKGVHGAAKDIDTWYEQSRVSKKKGSVDLVYNGLARKCYITSLTYTAAAAQPGRVTIQAVDLSET